MTVRSSISLAGSQTQFARSLVESGRYASLSSVLQHGLELLRQHIESEGLEPDALRKLVDRRTKGPFVSASEMDARIERIIARKQREVDVRD